MRTQGCIIISHDCMLVSGLLKPAVVQMETKQESLGVRGESLETDSQQHMRQSLRNSNSVNDSQVRLQLRGEGGSHAMLGEESGSQLAARLNSSTFGTEQVLALPSRIALGSLHFE